MDFPTSLPDFYARFCGEAACFDYLREVRWPDGLQCSKCGTPATLVRLERRAVQCTKCDALAYLTAGTVMHRSRQRLSQWLLAAFLLVVDKRGISAVQLQRAAGIKRHETAYLMLHRLRAAMVAPERELLHGTIEVDETFVGGKREGPGGRGALGKNYVIGAVEVREGKPRRVRWRHIPEITRAEALDFLRANVAPTSLIVTDGGSIYRSLENDGWRHRAINARATQDPDAVLPRFHLACSNLKAWLRGTFHGAVRKEHLQAYLNEFAYRYNRRGNLQAAFLRLLGIGSQTVGPTLEGLYEGNWAHPR